MNRPPEPLEPLSPAEHRLIEHLQLLRTDAPIPPPPMVGQIVRAARWQRAVRQPLLAISAMAAAVGEGVRLLVGSRNPRS